MLTRNATLALAVVLLVASGALADPALYWASQTAVTGTGAARPDIVGPDGVEVPSGSHWLIQLLDLDTGNVLFSAPAGAIMDIGHGASYGVFYKALADVGIRRGSSVGTRVFNSDSEATATHRAMFSQTTALIWDTVPSAPATFTYDAGQVAQGDWELAISRYTVTFQPGAHGTLAGGTPAVTLAVNHGDPAPAAPAVTPAAGWLFTGWSPLLPATITADAETTAQYAAGPVPPNGEFLAAVDANAGASGRGLWDLSGAYTTTVAGAPLVMAMVHDPTGRLTGTATYSVAKATLITMPIRGSVRGAAGNVVVKIAMKGADSAHGVSVSLTLSLTLDPANRRLTGPLAGSVKSGAASTPVSQAVTLDLPARMDGTWTLAFQLAQAGRGVTGTALLTLSNGVNCALVVQGKASGANAVLSLAGAPADPAARAIRIRTTIAPLAGASANLLRFFSRGYGQSLLW